MFVQLRTSYVGLGSKNNPNYICSRSKCSPGLYCGVSFSQGGDALRCVDRWRKGGLGWGHVGDGGGCKGGTGGGVAAGV